MVLRRYPPLRKPQPPKPPLTHKPQPRKPSPTQKSQLHSIPPRLKLQFRKLLFCLQSEETRWVPLHMARIKRSSATMASALPYGDIDSCDFIYVPLTKSIVTATAGWQWYDRDKLADPSNMNFRKVQRVNYAFFQPDVQGNIYGTDRWGDPQVSVFIVSSSRENTRWTEPTNTPVSIRRCCSDRTAAKQKAVFRNVAMMVQTKLIALIIRPGSV